MAVALLVLLASVGANLAPVRDAGVPPPSDAGPTVEQPELQTAEIELPEPTKSMIIACGPKPDRPCGGYPGESRSGLCPLGATVAPFLARIDASTPIGARGALDLPLGDGQARLGVTFGLSSERYVLPNTLVLSGTYGWSAFHSVRVDVGVSGLADRLEALAGVGLLHQVLNGDLRARVGGGGLVAATRIVRVRDVDLVASDQLVVLRHGSGRTGLNVGLPVSLAARYHRRWWVRARTGFRIDHDGEAPAIPLAFDAFLLAFGSPSETELVASVSWPGLLAHYTEAFEATVAVSTHFERF